LDVTFLGGAYAINLTTGVTNFVGETAVNFESDIYRYTAFSESTVGAGRDIINGFDRGLLFFSPKDRIDLSAIDSNLLVAGNQAFGFIGTGAFTGGGSGEVRYFLSGTNVIVEVDVRGDGNITANMQIQLNGIGGVNASNFIQ
jgi:serralysin